MFLYMPSKTASLIWGSALHLGTGIWYTFEAVGELTFNDLYSLWKQQILFALLCLKYFTLRLIYLDMALMVE